jgi:hypothetical protein
VRVYRKALWSARVLLRAQSLGGVGKRVVEGTALDVLGGFSGERYL